MALSYEERKALLQSQAATASTFSLARTMAVATEELWTKHNGYPYFDNYRDPNISTIDDKKNVDVHESQVNISQEVNSQFIPFEMARFYDGIDLASMALSVHFTTSDNVHFASTPVNVETTKDKIRFVWLVDENATHISGNIKFEIHADGAIIDSNGVSYGYRWKSKPTEKFNIVKSICEDPDCEPVDVSEDWVVELVENVANSVVEKIAEANVEAQVKAAENAADRAEAAADEVSGMIDEKLKGYYTKAEVYNKDTIDNLEKRIADLEYIPIKINSFNSDPELAEKGDTINTVTLRWFINKTPKEITIDDVAINNTDTSKQFETLNLESNKTWTIKVKGEREGDEAVATTGIAFVNKIYYGVSKEAEVSSSLITGLTYNILSQDVERIITLEAREDEYIYYCVPSTLGVCKFNVGGFDGGFTYYTGGCTVNGESYYVYRSDNKGLGLTTIKITNK